MIREIYCKLPSDINYVPNIETQDEAFSILQQIKVILGTKHGEVLGSYSFGVNLQEYLFTYNMSREEILYALNAHLANYVYYDTSKYNVYVDVQYGHDAGGITDYAVVDVFINEKACLGILVNQE